MSLTAAAPSSTDAIVQSAPYDIFIDLSDAGLDGTTANHIVDRLVRDDTSARLAGCVTLACATASEPRTELLSPQIDADSGQPPAILLARAMRRAATSRRHLVVLLGPVIPDTAVLAQLIAVFDRDPQFGTVQPRFADDQTEQIWPLPGTPDRRRAGTGVSPKVLRFLPDITITPEFLAACVVIRWQVLVATDDLDYDYRGILGALLHLLCRTRRRGMRNVVVNQAVVPSHLRYEAVYPVPPDADLARLRASYPDHRLAEEEITRLGQRRMEALLGAAHPDRGERRVLLDGRDLPAGHNGSTQCVLGFLDGFAALDCARQIDVLVSPGAASFHRMAERYSSLHRVSEHLDGDYFAAVTLTQPWSLKSVTELHRHALVVAFTMLDTIGWDVLYPPGAAGLGTLWRFVARHADAMLYISEFTRERFNTRFPLDGGVAERVTHLSFRQDEHVHPAAQSEPVSDYILVFGNAYDHKDLQITVQLLVDAFPFNRIVAFGTAEAAAPNVTAIPSGKLESLALHRLIAGARVIVYPSNYEGFGLPVVEGLAYGRPVVVRQSPLWAEIAGCSRLPGALIEFDDPASLVERVGGVLAGLASPPLPSGVQLPDERAPAGWRECAGRVMEVLNGCVVQADGSRWRAREEALQLAYR
jgi:glycosyltransferase involved in cell wall biosynthesis